MAGSLIDLRRLRYFRAIVRYGSLSEAARHLHITQPALTHHMNQLEGSLGVRLLDRFASGVVPTEAGSVLVRHAISILEQVGHAEDEIRALTSKPGQPMSVRLAITPAVSSSLAPALLAIRSLIPEISLIIGEVRTRDAGQLLRSDQADLAVVIVDDRLPDNAVQLAREHLVFVSASRQKSSVGVIPCRELESKRLILPSLRRTLRPLLNKKMTEIEVHLNIVAEIEGINSRKQAVLAGLGDTITSYLNVARECTEGQLFASVLVDPQIVRFIALEARVGFPESVRNQIASIISNRLAEILMPVRTAVSADAV